MEGEGDSTSSQATESILLAENAPEGNTAVRTICPVKEHVESEEKKNDTEVIRDDGANVYLNDLRGCEVIQDAKDDGGNGLKIASNDNDIEQHVFSHSVNTHGNSNPTEREVDICEADITMPSLAAQEHEQSEMTGPNHDISCTVPANTNLSSQSRLDSDNARTTDLPLNDGQSSLHSETRYLHTVEIPLRDSGLENVARCFDRKIKTSTSLVNASPNPGPSIIADYSSPEMFLLSVSPNASDSAQQKQGASEPCESLSPLPNAKASNAQSVAKLVDKQTESKAQDIESNSQIPSRTESAPFKEDTCRSSRMCLDQDDDLLSELDAELDEFLVPQNLAEAGDPMNGLVRRGVIVEDLPEFKLTRAQVDKLQKNVESLHGEIKRMEECLSDKEQQVTNLEQEKESLLTHVKQAESVQSVHLLRIKELELLIEQQKVEFTVGKERQVSHDAAAKKAIAQLQQEMILRVDQVKSMYEEAIKEKEAVVIKYAKSEKEVLDQKKLRETSEKNYKELNLTVESLKTRLHDTKKDRSKLKNTAASKETEASYLQKEVDQLKEEVSSQGIKVKWAQNKLKTELDGHKETKVKLAKTEQRLTEAKEETEQIRKNCQDMIKTYQTSEEVKSNSLDKQLKVKHNELEQKLQEQKEHLEVHQARLRELESLKKSLADNIAELDSLKVKNKCLEDERLQNEELLAKFKELLNSQKEENRRLNKQLEEKKALAQELENLKQTEIQLRSEVFGQKVDQSDLEGELETSRQKESELLQFTEKITTKNTALNSENACLQSKASQLESSVQKLQRDLDELQTSYSHLSSELKQEHQFRERESSLLTTKLNEKSRAVEQLSIQLDEARDDNKTLKRKHVANTKDLTRQLQQAHKRLETLDSTENASRDNISVGSRTSSSGSLDTLPGSTPSAVNSGGSSVSVSQLASSRPEEHTAPHDHTVAIATGNDYPGVDKGMLVDRIVRLQKANQRKNEKMEFMQEHTTHLIEELKKKSKIIQQYIMRDEAGALVPVSSDVNKAQMSKQGGIMSSLYRSQSTDPTMTLDLSLEINRKLQAVLEDTLLKNITLKENIETLGHEIARLLKEQHKHQPGHV